MNSLPSPSLTLAVILIPFGFFFLGLVLSTADPSAGARAISRTKVGIAIAALLCINAAVIYVLLAPWSSPYLLSPLHGDSSSVSVGVTLIPFGFFFLWLAMRSRNSNRVVPVGSWSTPLFVIGLLLFINAMMIYALIPPWGRNTAMIAPPLAAVPIPAPPKPRLDVPVKGHDAGVDRR